MRRRIGQHLQIVWCVFVVGTGIQSHEFLQKGFGEFVVGEKGVAIDVVKLTFLRSGRTSQQFHTGAATRVETQKLIEPGLNRIPERVSDWSAKLDFTQRTAVGGGILCVGSCCCRGRPSLLVNLCVAL